MLGHPSKSYYIFKDVLETLMDANVLKFCPKQKKMMAIMMSFQFGKELMSVPAGVVPILKGKLRVINADSHNKKERDFVPVPTPRGEIILGSP